MCYILRPSQIHSGAITFYGRMHSADSKMHKMHQVYANVQFYHMKMLRLIILNYFSFPFPVSQYNFIFLFHFAQNYSMLFWHHAHSYNKISFWRMAVEWMSMQIQLNAAYTLYTLNVYAIYAGSNVTSSNNCIY